MSLKLPPVPSLSLSSSLKLIPLSNASETKPFIKNLKFTPIPEVNESPVQSPKTRMHKSQKSKDIRESSMFEAPKIQITEFEERPRGKTIQNNNPHIDLDALEEEIINFLLAKNEVKADIQDIMKHKLAINPKKTKYLTEKDLYLGDLVIVFPNPDAGFFKRNTMDISKLMKIYHKTFETEFAFYDKSLRETFFFAFLQAYEQLKPLANNKELASQSPRHSPKQKKAKDVPIENEFLVSKVRQEFKNDKKEILNRSNNSRRGSFSPTKGAFFPDKFQDIENFPVFPSPLIQNSLMTSTPHAKDDALLFPNNIAISKGFEQPPTPKINSPHVASPKSPRSPRKTAANLKVTTNLHAKFAKTKSIQKEFEKKILKDINKLHKKGSGALERLMSRGGYLEEVKPSGKWKQGSDQINDFFSLMRNSIIYKLSFEAGFKTRSFLDSNGLNIYTVLYSCDENLQITAELDNFNKQVSLSRTDLLSLEPVDRKLRPIRFHIKLRETDTINEKDGQYSTFVRPLILKLLSQINYKRICRELNIPGGDETVEIIDDASIPDELWQAYYEYLMIVRDGVARLRSEYKNPDITPREVAIALKVASRGSHKKKTPKARKLPGSHNGKIVKNSRKMILALGYEKLFIEAMESVNSQFPKGRKMLRTIWDHSKMTYQEAFFDYIQTPGRMSFRVKNKIDAIWKKYQVTEKGTVSLFTKTERLKLAYSTLQKFVNIAYLIDNRFISEIFALNDMAALSGISVKALLGLNANFQTIKTKQTIRRSSPNRITTMKENQTLTEEDVETTEANEALRQIYNNLEAEWKFKVKHPIFVPVDTIRNYYGEKIALYFQFLSHYTKYLTYMGFLGLIFTIVYYGILTDPIIHFIMDVFICISLGVWSNAFVIRWRRKELLFSIKYGQLDFEQDEQERSLFKGTCKRSLTNDQMNVISYSRKKKYSKMALASLMSLVLIIINMIFVALLFELVVVLYEKQVFNDFGWLRLDIVIPAFLNNVLNQFFTEIFTDFAMKYTKFENHRTLSLFESSFITKKFLFSLVIMITPLAFISFLNEFNVFGMQCVDSCSFQLLVYLRTYYFFSLFTNLWEIFGPKLKLAYKHFQDKTLDRKDTQDARRLFQSHADFAASPEERQQTENRDRFIRRANRFLEKESIKEQYSESQDLYGTVEDYMEICLNYALLALFGIGDPLVFFIALASMILEMQTDKHKLINYTKRPIPLGERTIGIWLELVEFVANVSVLTNSGIIAFTFYGFSASQSVIIFVILILISYSINWVLNSVFEEVPGNMARIVKRHKLLQEKTIQGIAKASSDQKKIVHKYPIFKVFNTKILIEGEDEFTDLNTLDYGEDDRGVSELNRKQALKKYRKEFREDYFKEFRWNPNMTTKTPGIVLQEIAHKKNKRSFEFRKNLANRRKKYGISSHHLSAEIVSPSKLSKFTIPKKKESELNASKPSDFLGGGSPSRKQTKKDNLANYLNLEFKTELVDHNGRNPFVDLSINSNDFLLPNDLENCLSRYTHRIIESKREGLPLVPALKFHEIISLRKSLNTMFSGFIHSILLSKRVFHTKIEEIWLATHLHQIQVPLAVRILEVDQSYDISDEFIKIRKIHRLLAEFESFPDNNSIKLYHQIGFRVRKRVYLEVASFDFLDETENSKSLRVEIYEHGDVLASQGGLQEILLRHVVQKRSETNAFYTENEILFFLEGFLGALHGFSNEFPELFLEIGMNTLIYQTNENEVSYFLTGPELDQMTKNVSEIRDNELKNVGKTIISMICLNKVEIDWEDSNALAITMETLAIKYPKVIAVMAKIFGLKVESALNLMNLIENENKSKPDDNFYLQKLKKLVLDENFTENSVDLARAYIIIGNEAKASEILHSIPPEKKSENALFLEALANLKAETTSLESFEELLMEYKEQMISKYDENDRREIKIHYFLAYKALQMRKFHQSITHLSNLWQTFQVNCLKENLPAFLKFYELQGMAFMDDDRPLEAIKSFEQLISLSAKAPRTQAKARLTLSRLQVQIGKPLVALETLTACLPILKKNNEPKKLLIYGFLGMIHLQLGQTIRAMYVTRKAQKWLLKNGVSRDAELLLNVIEFCWEFPELFESFPQDVRNILLSSLNEFCDNINTENESFTNEIIKELNIIKGKLKMVLARAYYYSNLQRSDETNDSAIEILSQYEKTTKKFLHFALELRLFLSLRLQAHQSPSLLKDTLQKIDQLNTLGFEAGSVAVFNRAFLLFRNEVSYEATELLIKLVRDQKATLGANYRALAFDFLGFIGSWQGEENSQDFWVEMLECFQGDEQMTLLSYLKLAMNLIMLKRFEKAMGFLTYLQHELEKEAKKGQERSVDTQIQQFDVCLLSAVCEFHTGNYIKAKELLELALETSSRFSKKAKTFENEKLLMQKFFQRFFKDRTRKSFLLSNLAKINAFLGYYEKSYFIFSKALRTIRKDFEHIKYSLKHNNDKDTEKSQLKLARTISQKSKLLHNFSLRFNTEKDIDLTQLKLTPNISLKAKVSNNISNKEEIPRLYSSGEASEGKTSKLTPPSKEEEILSLCLQSANPSNLLTMILNLVRVQMMTYKYCLAVEALEKVEKVLESLNDPGSPGVSDNIEKNSQDLKLVGFFCRYILVKALFKVGRYDRGLEKFREFGKAFEGKEKEGLNYTELKGLYWVRELSGWLNYEVFRNNEAGFKDLKYCLEENPWLFGESDASLLSFLDSFIKILSKEEKAEKADSIFPKSSKHVSIQIDEHSVLLFQIKEKNLLLMKEKYVSNSRVMALIHKAFGNIEASRKKYYDSMEHFKVALNHANECMEANHIIGEIYMDMAYTQYKQLKLIEAENLVRKTLDHYQSFCSLESSNWDTMKCHFLLARIAMKFHNMIEENIQFLNSINDIDIGKWAKHYIEVKLWAEDERMLKIFEEYRGNNLVVYLTKNLKGTFDDVVLDRYLDTQSSKKFTRHFQALEHLDKAIDKLKGRISPESNIYRRIEEKLIGLKYKYKIQEDKKMPLNESNVKN